MSTETANATTTEKKMYTLRSSDKESFEVEESVAMMSSTIKHLIEDGCSDNGIPLPNVSASILAKVIEYCQKHAAVESPTKKTDDDDNDDSSGVAVGGADAAKDDLKQWDKDFINVDQKTLMEIITAANYLDIKKLLDLTCQTVADKIKNMMPEQVRTFLNIENDFTPEEEAAVRNENPWAFESDT